MSFDEPNATFLDLKKDNILEIFKYLTPEERVRLMGVNRQIRGDLIPIVAKELYESGQIINEDENFFLKQTLSRIKIFYSLHDDDKLSSKEKKFNEGIYSQSSIEKLIDKFLQFLLLTLNSIYVEGYEIDNENEEILKSNVKMAFDPNILAYMEIVDETKRPKQFLYNFNTTLKKSGFFYKYKHIKIKVKVQIFPITINNVKPPNFNENDVLFD